MKPGPVEPPVRWVGNYRYAYVMKQVTPYVEDITSSLTGDDLKLKWDFLAIDDELSVAGQALALGYDKIYSNNQLGLLPPYGVLEGKTRFEGRIQLDGQFFNGPHDIGRYEVKGVWRVEGQSKNIIKPLLHTIRFNGQISQDKFRFCYIFFLFEESFQRTPFLFVTFSVVSSSLSFAEAIVNIGMSSAKGIRVAGRLEGLRLAELFDEDRTVRVTSL